MDTPTQSAVAIITARGASKRIKNKNIRLFHNKPIIAYSIQTAIESQLFERVIVTTDDSEIAKIAENYGAEIPFIRDAKLADDFTGTVEVVNDAIMQLEKQNDFYTYICCIYPTAPLMKADDLIKAYQILHDGDVDYVFPVFERSPSIYRSLKKTESGGVLPVFEQYVEYRSQDLPDSYHDAGQFYWGKSKAFSQNKPIYSEHSRVIVLPSNHVCDIDYEDDWIKAEQMYHALIQKS